MNRKRRIEGLVQRILFFLVSVFILSVLVFYLSRLAPGDPLVSYYGERAEKMSTEEREWAEDKLGLNAPIHVQYISWLQNVFRGDFGISYKYKMDVKEVVGGRIGNTLVLGGIGFVLIFGLALAVGILCAWHEDKLIDRIICKIGTITSCIPEFWLSLTGILIFAVTLRWLPSSGAYSIGKENNLGDRIRHLLLPLSVIVISHLWYYAYMIRNKLLEEARAEYVLLARMKGLHKRQVLLGHCLRNVMPVYFSLMALAVPHVLGGTYIVETVFSYPGIGTLAYESARYQDYNLLMLLSLFTGVIVIFCNMLAQTVSERIDPRLRMDDGKRYEEMREL